MANEPGVGRFLGVHPPFEPDEYHSLKYDSASEPESIGRRREQPRASQGSAGYDTAVAAKSDLTRYFDEEWGGSEDLLTGAPKGGDRPDNPIHPDPKE